MPGVTALLSFKISHINQSFNEFHFIAFISLKKKKKVSPVIEDVKQNAWTGINRQWNLMNSPGEYFYDESLAYVPVINHDNTQKLGST